MIEQWSSIEAGRTENREIGNLLFSGHLKFRALKLGTREIE
jgi:hypothetical protein